ncbi:hypothetical protein EBBID32_1660 [Sphingobium indicum BiD32]|uniref:Uncharacterized protein n=1 Tax=Sphingobium indicum BiD32 TaxID=1301087 RepID=N1MK84_9SPHN|nr:hypothetical protein [Sphingobium indicum]CCW15838.1 hypothetical protein EBBID32_1660 [Sphingobium indicum BiD32]
MAVARKKGRDTGLLDIKWFCGGQLSRAEMPKRILFMDALFRTVNGKIRKADINTSTLGPQLIRNRD